MHKTLSSVTVKAADKGEVSAVFSTFNVIDKDGDLTLPGAIKDGTEVVVQPGLPVDGGIEILSGLNEGDVVVRP